MCVCACIHIHKYENLYIYSSICGNFENVEKFQEENRKILLVLLFKDNCHLHLDFVSFLSILEIELKDLRLASKYSTT